MTPYEIVAICLSSIAILIPIIQWAWKKWVCKAKLNYYPTGQAYLYFNQSGSYIRIDGVFEALKKPIALKNVSLHIRRQKDDQKLNLTWSSFVSPVNQSIAGAFTHTTEYAHPFRIEADSISCAFIEFGDQFNTSGKIITKQLTCLAEKIKPSIDSGKNYESVLEEYCALPEFATAKNILEKEFYWEIGKYDVDIEVRYENKMVHFYYQIIVDEAQNTELKQNIEESLISPIKHIYRIQYNYKNIRLELQEKHN